MKFLSCYGGATVATADDTTGTLPQQGPVVPLNYVTGIHHASSSKTRGRFRKVQAAATNWKPVLSVILENSVVISDVAKNISKQSVRSDHKKSSAKPKSSIKVVRSSSSDSDDYRKSVHPMALPAFSPAPFLF